MNLFILDHDVELNVQYHVDSHVNKIALEAAQVLSTSLFLAGYPGVAYDAAMWNQRGVWDTSARKSMPRAYLPTHLGPLANWCCDPINYMWTLRYAIELCKEHKYRHGTVIQTWHVLSQLPRFTVHRAPSMWYAAVTDDLLTTDDHANGKRVSSDRIVNIYRSYYQRDKGHLHRWTKRERPSWL